MGVVLQLLFLTTYLLSSYVTNQPRLQFIVGEIQDSDSGCPHPNLKDPSKIRLIYTKFSQAKKAGPDTSPVLARLPFLHPPLSVRYIGTQKNVFNPAGAME